MFGYITVNKQEMKFKEFDLYQSYYCGFCRKLKEKYGAPGQMTLSYDLTFLIILLTSLYETETRLSGCKCVAHPFERHPTRINEFTDYVADMNLLLSYYKCEDDWLDERKITKKAMASMLTGRINALKETYKDKAELISDNLNRIHQCESEKEENIDKISGYFGEIMAEIFAVRSDEWENDMRKIGFFLGKFIYLLDAYEDIEKDLKDGNYNPLSLLHKTEHFEEDCEQILTMMMAECSKTFEKLPVIENTEIMRNILYSGVWCRYEQVKQDRLSKNQESEHK